MPCRKSLTLTGGCELETCTTADWVQLPATDWVREKTLAYSPDHCYSCFLSVNNPLFTTTKWNRYDPATNTVIEKASYAVGLDLDQTYDAKHGVFVSASGDRIFLFDPVTETLTSFLAGVGGSIFNLVYVPEKELTYGHFGVDGSGNHYVGYVDLDLQIGVQLGIIPALGGSHPFAYNLVYSPIADALYGAWQTGVSNGILKFDLATSTGSLFVGAVTGIDCCWDSDQEYLVVCGGTIFEWDTDTDAVVRTTLCPAGYDLRWTPFYVSSLTKVFASGYEYPSGDLVIASFNTDTAGFVKEKEDFSYYGIGQYANGSFLGSAYNNGTNRDGVRRLCLT